LATSLLQQHGDENTSRPEERSEPPFQKAVNASRQSRQDEEIDAAAKNCEKKETVYQNQLESKQQIMNHFE
jgi:hypothetical protein